MNGEFDKKNFDELLKEFDKLTFRERQNPTFLEILKQQTRETAWSNILAFYFNPNKEHKLYDLLLKSFFEALGKTAEVGNLKAIKVNPEVSTENRKRIDLVIEADNFVIGIENKVNHWLNNDLEEYGKKIIQIANKKSSYKVVLTKFHCCPDNDFINLTYEVFIKHINRNIPYYTENANPEYLMFLNDFLRNIENEIKTKDMIENNESLEFFRNHYDFVNELTNKFEKTKEQVNQKFNEIQQSINLTEIDNSFKIRHGTSAYIHKADIEDIDGLIFWISICNGIRHIKIEIAIYSLNIYCYSTASNISIENYDKDKYDYYIDSLIESNGLTKLELDISEDTKTTVAKISNYVSDITGQIFEKLLPLEEYYIFCGN